MKTPWIILGSAFTAVVLVSGAFQVVFFGVPWLGDRTTERQTYTQVIRALVVEAESSDVRVLAGTTPDVKVTRKLRWHSDKPRSEETWSGNTLTIRPLDCEGRGLCEIDYTIEVPAGTEVDLTTSSGDAHTKALTGDQTITSSSGDIDVAASSGPLRLRASSGDIEVTATEPSSIDVRTSSGDIDVSLPPGAYDADADADSGDVSVDVQRDSESTFKVNASANSGDVTISAR